MFVCGVESIKYYAPIQCYIYIVHNKAEQGTEYFQFSEELFVCRETFMKVGPKLDENYTTTNVSNLLLTYYMPAIGTYYLH